METTPPQLRDALGEGQSVRVPVAAELFRLALYVQHVAPNLCLEVGSRGDASEVRLAGPHESPHSVAQTLARIREAIASDFNLAVSHPAHKSRLLGRLNLDTLLEVFAYLEAGELRRLAHVSVGLRRLVVGADSLWVSLAERQLPCWYGTFLRCGESGRQVPPATPGVSQWYQRVCRKLATDRKWLNVRRDPPAVHERSLLRGLHCIYFDEKELICGSGANNEVFVIDLRTGQKRESNGMSGLFGHTAAVSAVQPIDHDPSLLITSSLDHTMRLWDRRDLQCRAVFRGHTDKVWCVQAHENRIFSGGSDKTVKVWDLHSTKSLACLKDHRTSISCLRLAKSPGGNSVTLVTGSAGNTIRVWDITASSAVCTAKLRGHEKGVFCLHYAPSVLLSGSLDNTIKVWDPRMNYRFITSLVDEPGAHEELSSVTPIDSPQPPPIASEERSGIITFCCDDTKIVSGGPEQVIKLWDLRMLRLVSRFHGHSHWVTSLQFDDDKIVSASRDRTIRFWDISGRMLDHIRLPAM